MNQKEKEKIIEELNKRIDDAKNAEEYDVSFALENFYEWFFENYVY